MFRPATRRGWLCALPMLWLGCNGLLIGGQPELDGGTQILPPIDGGAIPDGGTSDDPLAGLPPANHRYYVRPTGDDSSDGLSIAHPWRSVAKVNAMAFQPGDQILFARGGSWNESLSVSSDGTETQPLVFASFGTGPKPRFSGSDALTPARFQATLDTSVFTYPITGDVNCAIAGERFLVLASNPDAVHSTAGTFSVSGSAITLHTAGDDPRSGAVSYAVCRREDGVYTQGHGHLWFRDLVTDGTAKQDGGYGFRVMNSTDVRLENCEAYRAGKHHFGVINSTGFIGTGLYAAYALPAQGAGGASAYVTFGDFSTPLTNQTSQWRDCTWEHPEDLSSPGSVYPAFYGHGQAITSTILHNLVSRGAPVTINNGDNPSGVLRMEGGWIDNARLEVDGDGAIVDGVKITGPLASIDVVGSHITLQNLLVYGANPQSQWYQTAIASRGQSNTLRFSTVVMDTTAARYNTCIALVNANTAFTFYGNILQAPHRVLKQWAGAPDSADIAEARYNLYPAGATFNDGDLTLGAWQSAGLDTTSLAGDPRFTSASTGDYSLQAGSIAIDAAPLDASLLSTMPTDYLGVARRAGTSFDIGAIERQ